MSQKEINILLVEDDVVDVKNIQRAFKKNNITHPLHVAHDGIEALELLNGTDTQPALNPVPDVILLDINMPRMNGLELLKELRADERFNKSLIFVITTSDDQRDRVEAYKYNVAGYFLKPIESDLFTNILSTLSSYWDLVKFPN